MKKSTQQLFIHTFEMMADGKWRCVCSALGLVFTDFTVPDVQKKMKDALGRIIGLDEKTVHWGRPSEIKRSDNMKIQSYGTN